MDRASWYKLDNVGRFYAAEAAASSQTVFRFAAEMIDEVDAEYLQEALNATVARFPGFNVVLRSGFFWHYLEPSSLIPQVQPEDLPICFGLHTGPKSVLFRVSYYRRRINLEVSHIISDGRGTLSFFRALISEYAQRRYRLHAEDIVCSEANDTEDGFSKYYERGKAASTPTQRAYRLRGIRDVGDTTHLEYHLSASKVHGLAKSYGVSVTSVIIAAVICALCETRPESQAGMPIRLTVPVDLRQFFESGTMRNFFGLATVTYNDGSYESLESVAAHVQKQLKDSATPDELEKRMNRMISLERSPFLKFAPLFLKDLALNAAARISSRDITSAVSSLGRISFSQQIDRFVRSVNLQTSTFDLNFLICTFEDDLSIGISTIFTDLKIIRSFCRIFSAQGIEGRININRNASEVAKQLRSAQLQETVENLRRIREERKEEESYDALR